MRPLSYSVVLFSLAALAGCNVNGSDATEESPIEEPSMGAPTMGGAPGTAGPDTNADGGWSLEGDAAAEGDAAEGDAGAPPPPPPSVAMERNMRPTSQPEMKYCDALRTQTSVSYCDLVEQQQKALAAGVGAFDPPRNMTRGQVTRVRFAVGAQGERAATIEAAGGGEDSRVVDIKIGRFMRASLSGAGFEIEPVGGPERDLGLATSETWEWDVTPTANGERELQVKLETLADTGNQKTRMAIYTSPPIKVTINVSAADEREAKRQAALDKLTFSEKIIEALTSWFTALGALALAIGIAVWRVRKIGSKPDEEEDEPEGEGGE